MCERFYISYRFEGNLKVNMANNVIMLLFYILTQASHIFFRLLLNLIFKEAAKWNQNPKFGSQKISSFLIKKP